MPPWRENPDVDDGETDVLIGERTFKIGSQFVRNARPEPLSLEIASIETGFSPCTARAARPPASEGIDSIATGHWTMEFRLVFLLVRKAIRKLTTYHTQGGRR